MITINQWDKREKIIVSICAVITALVAVIGIFAPHATLTQTSYGSGDNVGRDKIVNVNTPTFYQIENVHEQKLPNGMYVKIFTLKHIGEQVIPKFGVGVEKGYENLAYGMSNGGGEDRGYPLISIKPFPSAVYMEQSSRGRVWYNLPPQDYEVSVVFKSKPETEPEIRIFPLK